MSPDHTLYEVGNGRQRQTRGGVTLIISPTVCVNYPMPCIRTERGKEIGRMTRLNPLLVFAHTH